MSGIFFKLDKSEDFSVDNEAVFEMRFMTPEKRGFAKTRYYVEVLPIGKKPSIVSSKKGKSLLFSWL
ncbi:hypothetical protein VHTUMSATKI_37770 [Vibrio harveyi]